MVRVAGALGVIMVTASIGPAAIAAMATGSMYNGNNVDPPAAFIAEQKQAEALAAAQQNGNEATDNRGGNSATARAGGGG